MMTFATYYNTRFRSDLAAVVAAAPPLHEHCRDEVTIQPRTVSRANPIVRRWNARERMQFAAALFLTILTDQVCYTHFRDSYPQFRELTRYPKWRGDCPGGCSWHAHPQYIWSAIGSAEGQPYQRLVDLPLSSLPDDVLATMEHEVQDFVRQFLPTLDPSAFWARCEAEFPSAFRLLYLGSRAPRSNDR